MELESCDIDKIMSVNAGHLCVWLWMFCAGVSLLACNMNSFYSNELGVLYIQCKPSYPKWMGIL